MKYAGKKIKLEVDAGESVEIDINKLEEKFLSSEQSSEAEENGNELQVETGVDFLDKSIEILLRNDFMSDIKFLVNYTQLERSKRRFLKQNGMHYHINKFV